VKVESVPKLAMWIGVLALAAGCGDGRPTRGECARALAHEWMIEDISQLHNTELATAIAQDGPPTDEDEAMKILEVSERGGRFVGEKERLLTRCVAGTRTHVDCVLRAPDVAAFRVCPK